MSRSNLPAFVLALALVGCADLPPLNVCGNGLVDGNEDCDGTDGKAADGTPVPCGAPNEVRACRFTCDVNDPHHPGLCPVGYACSAFDGICRAPSGSFAQAESFALAATRLDLADLDGDGLQDLVVSNDGYDATAIFPVQKGAAPTVVALPPLIYAGVGSVTSTSTSDLIALLPGASGNYGMVVLEGAQRSFAPASFSSFPLEDGRTVLPYHVAGQSKLLALEGDQLYGYTVDYSRAAHYATLAPKPDLTIGRVTAFGKLQGLAFGYRDHVGLFFPEQQNVGSAPISAIATVSVPAGRGHVIDFWLEDIDSDGDADIVMTTGCDAADGPGCKRGLFVGYGYLDAASGSFPTFHVWGDVASSSSTLVGEALPWKPTPGEKVLAILDADRDGIPDIVTSDAIRPGYCAAGPPCKVEGFLAYPYSTDFGTPQPDTAVVGDFNDDGRKDIIAGSSKAPGVYFALTVGGGLFNVSTIATSGATHDFTVADFDGDLFLDVAFAETIDKDAAQIDFLFGGFTAQPTGPLVRGPFAPVSQIVANPNILTQAKTERSDLLAVTGTKGAQTIAVFPASPTREFFSPYFFVESTKGAASVETPEAVVVGNFDGRGGGDLACLAGDFSSSPRLWLLASQDSGSIGSTKAPVSASGAAAIVRVPGREGEVDRIALFEQPAGATTMSLGHAAAGSFAFDPPLSFHGVVPTSIQPPGAVVPNDKNGGPQPIGNYVSGLAPVCVADLDGDGYLDLATVVNESKGGAIEVLWGDAAGHFAAPKTVSQPSSSGNSNALWLACVHAHATTGSELAVVTDGDLRVFACAADRSCAFDQGSILDIAWPKYVYASGSMTEPSNQPIRPVKSSFWSSITAITTGDMTGDGIDDIVVSGVESEKGSLTVLLAGTPKVP